jgi:uncharacterized protein
MSVQPAAPQTITGKAEPPIFPFVAPTVVFGVLTALEGYVPTHLYVVAYAVKAVAVTSALLVWRQPLRDIKPDSKVVVPSILLGLVVCVAWVGLDKAIPYPHLGERAGFDPYSLPDPLTRAGFVVVRLYGLVLMVPVMEEILWRSFLLRYITHSQFLSIPIGEFSSRAFAVVIAASALAHPEWLVAAVANIVYCAWLRRTRSLFATIVAHAATNAALGGYVLATHEWQYW